MPTATLDARVNRAASLYRICTRCIMDTSDREITFNADGICNHCRQYDQIAAERRWTTAERERRLQQLLKRLREHGRGKEYDCVVGVSGGVDSTYVAYKLAQFAVRPLAVHLDNGWNSELAVHNIERVLRTLKIDLYTHVLDWDEFKDLQLAFLKASVSDAEIPTDHAISATLYMVARSHGLKYIINGLNTVTEAVLPGSWTYGIHDWKYISNVHKRFGTVKLRTFPHHTRNELLYYEFILGLHPISLLDYIPYVMQEDREYVKKKLGLTEAEFEQITALPVKTYRDYPNYEQRTWVDPFRDTGLFLAKQTWRMSRRLRGLPLRNRL